MVDLCKSLFCSRMNNLIISFYIFFSQKYFPIFFFSPFFNWCWCLIYYLIFCFGFRILQSKHFHLFVGLNSLYVFFFWTEVLEIFHMSAEYKCFFHFWLISLWLDTLFLNSSKLSFSEKHLKKFKEKSMQRQLMFIPIHKDSLWVKTNGLRK